jgi:hypothetical protein
VLFILSSLPSESDNCKLTLEPFLVKLPATLLNGLLAKTSIFVEIAGTFESFVSILLRAGISIDGPLSDVNEVFSSLDSLKACRPTIIAIPLFAILVRLLPWSSDDFLVETKALPALDKPPKVF